MTYWCVSGAMIHASDWLLDQANEKEAMDLLATTIHRNQVGRITRKRSAMSSGRASVSIDLEGNQGAMALRNSIGVDGSALGAAKVC